jgi:integrase
MKTLPRLRVTQEEYEEFTVRKRERRYWEERKIVFHSWRHFYTSRMAENLEKEKVMLATGHKSGVVFDTYADHVSQEVLTEVAGVTRQVFHRLVS